MLPFDKVYVLNVKKRTDRLEQFKSEMERIDSGPYEIHYADPDPYPILSFCRSHHQMLKKFVDSGAANCLILEDDVIFQNMNHLVFAMDELPGDWATLHLGANATQGVAGMAENWPQAYSRHLIRLRCAWTSQAIAYNRYMAEYLVNFYDPETKHMFDDFLSHFILPTNPCFMVRPTVAWQRPGYSDLWGGEQDYTNAWKITDEIISKL